MILAIHFLPRNLFYHIQSYTLLCRGIEDPQLDLVDPAVKGTRNVIGAAAKSKDTVRRVVLTSSTAGTHLFQAVHSTYILEDPLQQTNSNGVCTVANSAGCCAAVVKNRKGPANGSLYTEEDWNDESSLTESPYMYSKVNTSPKTHQQLLSLSRHLRMKACNPNVLPIRCRS